MIKEATYQPANTSSLDAVVQAFSALDHSILAELAIEDRQHHVWRVIFRLATLLSIHGNTVPISFINTLEETSENYFSIVNSFLETGLPPTTTPLRREIQQEVVHFSRIADLDAIHGLFGGRRLRRSTRLPSSLKFLSELHLVLRSRFGGRNLQAEDRYWGSPKLIEITSEQFVLKWSNSIAIIWASRRRSRSQVAYLMRELSQYLTPKAAFWIIIGYLVGDGLHNGCSIDFIEANPDKVGSVLLTWRRSVEQISSLGSASSNLPLLLPLADVQRLRPPALGTIEASATNIVEIRVGSTHLTLPRSAHTANRPSTEIDVPSLLSQLPITPVATLECGHIHLNRLPDQDQQTGLKLGYAVYDVISAHQSRPPLLTPLFDDDHVIVDFRPRDYRRFLDQELRGLEYHLIPESSPIVRGIAFSLYHLLHEDQPHALQRKGDNLYYMSNSGGVTELIEGINGEMIIGCVLFETALLLYRSEIELFTRVFEDRYRTKDVHDKICSILDTHLSHDNRFDELRRFNLIFKDMHHTAIFRREIELLRANGIIRSHLNILEYYYASQQQKVRNLSNDLGLPIRLITLHFDVFSNQVTIDQ